MFQDGNKNAVRERIEISWDDIFKTIGPSMYGYIVRKNDRYNQSSRYPFQDDVEDYLRSMVYDRVQRRKIDIMQSQIDTCVIQLKELGLLMFAEKRSQDGSIFRGVTLTEFGEKYLACLKTEQKS
jgi:hypothetical protein